METGKTKRLKIFLSHPMSGLSESEVLMIRERVLKHLKNSYGEVELLDNYYHKNAPDNAGRLWYLGTSIRMMETADIIYFCNGWENANGCKVEYNICKLYGLRTEFEKIEGEKYELDKKN